ncbi:hypothetical protein CEXT_192631 [Caerostris extrusa]|uniref:Uncharacterized protein n=1 Tax=Caerostris extrusa TaxID=172846 RepID=A0AAV4SX42_CAEEX|nr:hypothetical protein CEXT_192631 [Caerostris extrusa]
MNSDEGLLFGAKRVVLKRFLILLPMSGGELNYVGILCEKQCKTSLWSSLLGVLALRPGLCSCCWTGLQRKLVMEMFNYVFELWSKSLFSQILIDVVIIMSS